MTGQIDSHVTTLNCRRFDFSAPVLIFGGLLLAATAAMVDLDEVKVLAEQPVIAPRPSRDYWALGCENEKGKAGLLLKRCKSSRLRN